MFCYFVYCIFSHSNVLYYVLRTFCPYFVYVKVKKICYVVVTKWLDRLANMLIWLGHMPTWLPIYYIKGISYIDAHHEFYFCLFYINFIIRL